MEREGAFDQAGPSSNSDFTRFLDFELLEVVFSSVK